MCFLLVFSVFVIVKMYQDSQGTYISACSPVCLWQAGIYCSDHFSWLHISDLLCSPFPLLYCWDIDNPFQRLGDPYLLLRRGIYSMSEWKISQLAHDQGVKDKMLSGCNLHIWWWWHRWWWWWWWPWWHSVSGHDQGVRDKMVIGCNLHMMMMS